MTPTPCTRCDGPDPHPDHGICRGCLDDLVATSRTAQGLPADIVDPATASAIAALFDREVA